MDRILYVILIIPCLVMEGICHLWPGRKGARIMNAEGLTSKIYIGFVIVVWVVVMAGMFLLFRAAGRHLDKRDKARNTGQSEAEEMPRRISLVPVDR